MSRRDPPPAPDADDMMACEPCRLLFRGKTARRKFAHHQGCGSARLLYGWAVRTIGPLGLPA